MTQILDVSLPLSAPASPPLLTHPSPIPHPVPHPASPWLTLPLPPAQPRGLASGRRTISPGRRVCGHHWLWAVAHSEPRSGATCRLDNYKKRRAPSGALCRPHIFRRCSHFVSWPRVSRRESLAIAKVVVEHFVEIQSYWWWRAWRIRATLEGTSYRKRTASTTLSCGRLINSLSSQLRMRRRHYIALPFVSGTYKLHLERRERP
jgi:hypothetical protein